MSIFGKSRPWYSAGLAFECSQCGRCCAGPEEGHIWVAPQEIAAIAAFLNITEEQIRQRYVRKAGRGQSIIEQPGSKDCIFLAQRGSGQHARVCRIYSVRPQQCRIWPFWDSNLVNARAWALAQQRCPGINRGRLWTLDEIETRRKAADD